MATSQNGWTVFTSGTDSNLVGLGWVTGRVRRGAVFTIFDYLCKRFHTEVEPIRRDWSWGWAYRAIRGATSGYSNHASGTAIDLNAPAHPMGVFNTFTVSERAKIRDIVADLDGVVRWGGEWQNRPDDMHFEIIGTVAQVERVAAKISGLPVAPVPAPAPPSTGADGWDGRSYPGDDVFVDGKQHAAIKLVQERLVAHGYSVGADGIDGYWGANTKAATRAFQLAQGWTGDDADGIPGPITWQRLMLPPVKSITEMAQEIIAGEHGTGHDNRRRSLGVTPEVYEKVRAEVNRLLGISTTTASAPAPAPAPAPKPAAKTVAQMAQEVIDGKHGSGHDARRKSLGVSAATYEKVRAEVNRRVYSKPGTATKSIAQMALEVIAGKHGSGHAARRRSLGVTQSVYDKVRAEVNRRV